MAKKSSSELKKPKKNNKKSSKKFGPDAVAMKHQSSAQKTENPFETIWSRRKFDILGKKRKGEERRVGLSRSLAIEKRKKTLLKEYQQSGKSSVFVDKRIGEQNEELGEFDKSIMRYQRERQQQLKSSKKSKYNLSDGEDDELDILGGEQFLGRDDFEDEVPLQDDEDDEHTGSQSKSTFMDLQSPSAKEQAIQNGSSEGDTRHKSKKEVMEEIIFKSKHFKALKAKEKDENEQLNDQLDDQFKSMVQSKAMVSLTLPNKMNALKALVNKIGSSEDTKKNDVVAGDRSVVAQKEEPDSYDKLLFSMALDMRARASDRTKTPEEIAEEEKELLERLEAERKKRMVAADESSGEEDNALNDDDVSTKRKRTSGDDLGDSFGEEQITKVGWLEKVFKKKEANALEESDGSDDEDDDGEDEDEDDDDGEDEEDGTSDDGEETPTINSVKGWEQSDDDELDIGSEEDEEDVDQVKTTHRKKDPEKSERKVVSADSGEKKADAKQNLLQQGELPYTIEAPKSLEEFTSLIENRSHDQIIEAIRRIRKYNPISIAAEDRKKENRKKLQVFYGVLLQYFAVLSNKKSLDIKLLDLLVNPLLEMSADVPYFAAVCARERMLRTRSQFVEDMKNTGTSCWPSTKTLFLLRLWSIIFPCSDFRHAVMSPAIVLMCEYLTRCPVMSGRDVLVGSFLCSIVFSVMKQANKFCPEALLFIQTLLLTALDKNQISSDDNRLYHLLELKAPSRLLCIKSPVEEIKSLEFNNLMALPEDSPFFSSDAFKASILSTVADTIQGFIIIYEKFNSFPEIFNPIKKLLLELSEQKHMPHGLVNKINDIIQVIEKKAEEHQALRLPLQMRKKKPVPIRLLNPKFEENFVKGRDYDPDRERAELKKLKKALKREAKGAARELRKDNHFIADLKQKDKAVQEEERAEKYKKASAFLQEQEHAFKSGQLGKGRKRRK